MQNMSPSSERSIALTMSSTGLIELSSTARKWTKLLNSTMLFFMDGSSSVSSWATSLTGPEYLNTKIRVNKIK